MLRRGTFLNRLIRFVGLGFGEDPNLRASVLQGEKEKPSVGSRVGVGS